MHFFWLPAYIKNQRENLKTFEHAYLELLATSLTPDLLGGDLAKVYATLDAVLAQRNDWKILIVEDSQGGIIYPLTGKPADTPEALEWFRQDILSADSLRYSMRVGIDFERIIQQDRSAIRTLEYLLIGLLCFVSVCSIVFQERWIRKPLHKLAFAAADITQGDYAVALPPPTPMKSASLARRSTACGKPSINARRH